MNDTARLGGLVPDFRLYNRLYDQNLPNSIVQNGHGYLSKSAELNTDQYVRMVSGDQPGAVNAGGQSTSLVPETNASLVQQPVTQVAPQLQPLQAPATGTAVPMLASNAEANATLTAPLTVSVFPGKGFSANLSNVIGSGASVASVGLADGSPLPSWMSWDAESATIRSAQVPVNAASSYLVRAVVNDASGEIGRASCRERV